MKRAIIIGATSGMGLEVARIWAARGWKLGIAGRREEALLRFQASYPAGQVEVQPLDVTHDDAPQQLDQLIARLGGMDLFLLSSGIGSQNLELQPAIELATAATNVGGFIRLTTAAFHYFKAHGGGTSPSSAPSPAPRDWAPPLPIRPPNASRTPTSKHWSSWHACSTTPSASPTSAPALWPPTC